MVNTSIEYKEEQKQSLREKSFIYIYFGVINKEAQANATVNSGMTDYSTPVSAVKGLDIVSRYATLEDYFTRVNNTNSFLPRNKGLYASSQGIVTEGIRGSITFIFGQYTDLNIKGLTIDFGDEFPLAFTIANDHVEYEYEKDSPGIFTCEEQFDDTSFIRITPTESFFGQQRMRIEAIKFGVGIYFENEHVLQTQRRNSISHISEVLPVKSFDFTVVNISKKFSQDNPWSFANYIQEGQEVDFDYGRNIKDSEGNYSIYRVRGGKTYIKSWSSNDLNAKFSTVGLLDIIDSEYYKGYYNPNRTAYQAAVEVLEDAGILNYRIDTYLKSLPMHNPLPVSSHKACLQMIANASRAILFEDREGKVIIQSSFIPDLEDIVLLFENAEPFSDKKSLIEGTSVLNFATLEEGYTRIDEKMHFIPRDHSSVISDSSLVSQNGSVSLNVYFGAQWTFYNVQMTFEEVIPTGIIVEYYAEDVKKGEFTVDNIEKKTVFNQVFELVDRIIIRLTCDSSNRIHMSRLGFSAYSGYAIEKDDVMQMPSATSIEKVKEINVDYYTFAYGTECKKVSSYDVKVGDNIIKFGEATNNYSFLWEDENVQEWNSYTEYVANDYCIYMGYKHRCKTAHRGCSPSSPNSGGQNAYWEMLSQSTSTPQVTLLESGAYYIKIHVSGIPQSDIKLDIYGYPFAVNYNTYTDVLHELGMVRKLTNQMIQGVYYARRCSEWLADHFENDTEYNIDYRGEPAIDCDDLIYVENQFVHENLCRVVEEELSTSVGMNPSNKIKLRRVSYAEYRDAVVGLAIVDRDRVV